VSESRFKKEIISINQQVGSQKKTIESLEEG